MEKEVIYLRNEARNSFALQDAAAWFSSKWDVPEDAYKESIAQCIEKVGAVPQWYIMRNKEGQVVAGAGVIENDFHQRKDLSPNLCGLYVEETERNQGIAKHLLQLILKDMGKLGIPRLYLVTDHTLFYEKCGWKFLTMVTEESGDEIRMYTAPCTEERMSE